MKKYYPIDLSLKSRDYFFNSKIKFFNEIDSDNFSKFQNEIIDILIKTSINDKIIRSIIWDITNDISKIISIYYKIHKLKELEFTPIYEKDSNPLFDLIYTKQKPNFYIVKNIFSKKKYDQFSFYNFVKYKFKNFYSHEKKNIAFMRNDLMHKYIDLNSTSITNIDLHKLNTFKKIYNINNNYKDIIEHLVSNFAQIISRKVIIEDNIILNNILKYCIKNNLLNLINFQNYIDSNKSILKYQQFLSGSPKYWGRILSYNYTLHNKKTYRFAHSLDRVFFDDNLFKYSEYLFCDTYFFVSNKASYDAKKLLNKVDNFNILKNINFKSFKNNSFNKTYHKYKNINNIEKNILYISSTYLSEKNLSYSNDRIDMIQYFEYQEWLLNKITNLGFNVTFKQHPKSYTVIQNRSYKSFGQNNLKGIHIDDLLNYSVCIFDYAGSLLFDIMAKDCGIVFIDFKIRNWNNFNKDIFKQRCNTVEAFKNSKNYYRVDEQLLIDSLEQAKNNKYENTKFFKSYLNDK